MKGLLLRTCFIIIGLLMITNPKVFAKDIPYTLEDRDRLIRIEISLKEFKESVDRRFEAVDKRFEQIDQRFEQVDKRSDGIERRLERLETVMMWGFGLLFTSMMVMVGFVLWDRRTAIAPVIRTIKEKEGEMEELIKREKVVEEILREYSRGDERLAGLLKTKGLM